MTIKLIAQAVGLQADADESAVVAAVSQLNAFAGELKTLTKANTAEAVIGAIRGLQAAAEQIPTLTAKIDEQAKAIEIQAFETLIAADKVDPAGRKLTPALESWIRTLPLEAAKAYITAAPHLIKMQTASQSQEQPAPQGGTAPIASAAPMQFNGKTWEQMTGAEKHDLRFLEGDNGQTYEALKRNFAERGSPRAQSQQQRATA